MWLIPPSPQFVHWEPLEILGGHLRAPSLTQVSTCLGYFKRKGMRRGGRPPGSALSEEGRCQEREEQKRALGLGLSIVSDREWPRSSLRPSDRHTRSNKSGEETQMRAPLSPPPLHRTCPFLSIAPQQTTPKIVSLSVCISSSSVCNVGKTHRRQLVID